MLLEIVFAHHDGATGMAGPSITPFLSCNDARKETLLNSLSVDLARICVVLRS